MTRGEILAMPAGRELDRLVAKKVMGWTNIHDADGYGHWTGDPPDGYEDMFNCAAHCEGELPYYSADIAAAWEVVGKMGPLILLLHGLKAGEWTDQAGEVMCCPGWYAEFRDAVDWFKAWGETPALAICRAALVAMESSRDSGRDGA